MSNETDETRQCDLSYAMACRLVRASGKTTVAFLQREMRLGYNRAARLLEAMETEGIVTALDQHGARKLLLVVPHEHQEEGHA